METNIVYFQLSGIEYRYDGVNVEAKDGGNWNRTGSLSVILEAKKLFAAMKAEVHNENTLS